MNDDRYIQIERYLNKQMTFEQTLEFEQHLASDKELNKEYEATLVAHQLIFQEGRQQLKNTLQSFEDEHVESKKNSEEKNTFPLWLRRSLPIAALLLMFFAVYQFWNFNSEQTTSEVYATHFQVYQAPSALRTNNDSQNPNWKAGIALYRSKEYEEAIESFENAENDIPIYLSSFYIGISAMAQNQSDYSKAIQYFETVLQSDNDYRQQAQWYKGLALLKLGEQTEAYALFDEIVSNKSYNYEMAEKILKTKVKP